MTNLDGELIDEVIEWMEEAILTLKQFYDEPNFNEGGEFLLTKLRAAKEAGVGGNMRKHIVHLYDLLDDIDTLSDATKGDYEAFYKQVIRVQAKKNDTGITTDGYELTIPCEPAQPESDVQALEAENEKLRAAFQEILDIRNGVHPAFQDKLNIDYSHEMRGCVEIAKRELAQLLKEEK